jgi:hypothetical protein
MNRAIGSPCRNSGFVRPTQERSGTLRRRLMRPSANLRRTASRLYSRSAR